MTVIPQDNVAMNGTFSNAPVSNTVVNNTPASNTVASNDAGSNNTGMTGPDTNASFRQKSIALSLATVGSIGAYYFVQVFKMIRTDGFQTLPTVTPTPGGYWQLAIGSLILLVVVLAILQAILATMAGPMPAKTKRDQYVALKANRNAYNVLNLGAVITVGALFFISSPFVAGNILLLALALAEVTKFASQLIYYRLEA